MYCRSDSKYGNKNFISKKITHTRKLEKRMAVLCTGCMHGEGLIVVPIIWEKKKAMNCAPGVCVYCVRNNVPTEFFLPTLMGFYGT